MEGIGDIRSGRLLSLYVLVQLCYNLTEDKRKKKSRKTNSAFGSLKNLLYSY